MLFRIFQGAGLKMLKPKNYSVDLKRFKGQQKPKFPVLMCKKAAVF